MSNLKFFFSAFVLCLLFSEFNFTQTYFYEPLDINSIEWSLDDFGKMYTFDSVPLAEFEEKYGFKPTEEWLDDVKKSALQFGGGCSAAFVSSDGLIMTNHHCGRDRLYTVQKDGEDILKNGFYANTLEEERKIEDLFVEQLILIEDVTSVIKTYMQNGKTDDEKIKLRNEIRDSIVEKYNEKTNLNCKIVTLYHGGKYSLYGYKKYTDIRLVMAPDFQIAATGWDWDNFTYPRYELDFMFYRAYDDDGKPIKSENHFTWSDKGAKVGEPIFVIGRPGSTRRLLSYSHLEYLRDYTYPQSLISFNAIYQAYYDLYAKRPEDEGLLNKVMGWGNSRKSYAGRLTGLNNSVIMKKKFEFERELKAKVMSSSELNEKYGHLWNSLNIALDELKLYSNKSSVVRMNRFIKPVAFGIAENLLKLAKQKKMPSDEKIEEYQDVDFELALSKLLPDSIDTELENNLLKANRIALNKILVEENDLVKILYDENNQWEIKSSAKEF